MSVKPSLFIGSSTEGLDFARAVRGRLAATAEVTLWDEGFFELGSTFLENLVTALGRFDFAVLVLTPDDLVTSRAVESFGPRDNLLFELGLFMGRLGRSRTFVLMPATGLKLPTDLSGLVTTKYDWPRADGSHASAVGAACDGMRNVIRDMGVSDAKAAAAISQLRSRQEEQEHQLTRQQAEIRALQVALRGIVTGYELNHLIGLTKDEPFLCHYSDDFMNELKRLRALGLVMNYEGTGVGALRREFKDRNTTFDLKHHFFATRDGHEYLALRLKIEGMNSEE